MIFSLIWFITLTVCIHFFTNNIFLNSLAFFCLSSYETTHVCCCMWTLCMCMCACVMTFGYNSILSSLAVAGGNNEEWLVPIEWALNWMLELRVCVCVAVSYILATSNVDTRVHVNFRVPSYGHSMRSTDHKATKGSFPAIKHTCKTFALCFLCSRVYSSLCVFVVIHFTQLNLIGPVDRTPGWIKMHITLHKKDI